MYLATLMSYMYIVAKPPIFSKWIMEIVANFQKPQNCILIHEISNMWLYLYIFLANIHQT